MTRSSPGEFRERREADKTAGTHVCQWPGRRLSRLLLCIALGLGVTPAVRSDPPKDLDDWKRVEAASLVFFSNAGKRKTLEVVRRLETFRAALGLVLPALAQEPLRPTYVYVFNSSKSFHRYGMAQKQVAGFFTSRPEANYIAVDASAIDPYPIIYHEYAHYLLRNNLPSIPMWLNEGLAHYFETFTIERRSAHVGSAHPGLIYHLRNDRKWMDLSELIYVGPFSEVYNDPDRTLDFRAQAWLLVHYLFDPSPERRAQLAEMARLLSNGESSEKALTAAFGMTLEDLQSKLRVYERADRYGYRPIPLNSLDVGSEPRIRPMRPEEVLCSLGDLLLVHGDEENADSLEVGRYFRQALRIDADSTPALIGAARVNLAQENLDEAQRLLERSLKIQPSNAQAHYLLGEVSLHRLDEAERSYPRKPDSTPDVILRARDSFRAAFRIDGDFLAAYNAYAYTYVFDAESPQPGIDLATKVLARRPDLWLFVTLLELHSRAGNRDLARAVYDEHIETLLHSMGEPGIDGGGIAKTHTAILAADLMVAEAWATEGRTQEALRLLRELKRQTSDEDLLAEVALRIDDLMNGRQQ